MSLIILVLESEGNGISWQDIGEAPEWCYNDVCLGMDLVFKALVALF